MAEGTAEVSVEDDGCRFRGNLDLRVVALLSKISGK